MWFWGSAHHEGDPFPVSAEQSLAVSAEQSLAVSAEQSLAVSVEPSGGLPEPPASTRSHACGSAGCSRVSSERSGLSARRLSAQNVRVEIPEPDAELVQPRSLGSPLSADETAPGSALSSPKLTSKGRPAKQRVKHRKVRAGQTIFKGHPSYQIMMNLKLGIAYSSGRSAARRTGPLEAKDFHTVFTRTFPPEGCTTTPAHSTRIFTFKDHAPLAFRHLREHFGVSEQDYVVSICGENSLRELGTPGKSGAVFYLTEDYKFLIKTVSKKESKFLRRMLPNYYAHVMSCDSTLLPRFYGLIRITTQVGRNIRMVVMNNLMPEEATIHEKYDLKGSTLGRYATKAEKADPNCTLKDLDWRHKLSMPARTLKLLSQQVESDAAFLRELKIMDYSMLAMLHFPAREDYEPFPSPHSGWTSPAEPQPDTFFGKKLIELDGLTAAAGLGISLVGPPDGAPSPANSPRSPIAAPPPLPEALQYEAKVKADMDVDGDGVITLEEEVAYAKRLGGLTLSAPALAGGVPAYSRSASHQRSSSLGSRPGSLGSSTSRLLMRAGEPLKAARAAAAMLPKMPSALDDSDGDSGDEGDGHADSRLPSVSVTELRAAYERSQTRARDGRREPVAPVRIDDGLPCRLETGEEVVFFCGVIDILQQYGLRKQLEHRYKALRYARDRSGISVTDPRTYASRFLSFVLNIFEEQGASSARAAVMPEVPEDAPVEEELEAWASEPPNEQRGDANAEETAARREGLPSGQFGEMGSTVGHSSVDRLNA